MSFRELKLFSEIMKSLGYGRLISLDNFRSPNFELVADILYFFCDRIDSSIDLSDDISTKSKRVEFIKNCANILASKTQIKLKLKNVYKSDGYAVKELLKIAHFLNDANTINTEGVDPDDAARSAPTSNDIGGHLNKLREYTNLGGKIVENGVKLHNLLNHSGSSHGMMDQRVILFLDEMSHNLESYDNVIKKGIEKKLTISINDLDDSLTELEQHKLVEVKGDIAILQKKLEDKHHELERLQKRLSSLRSIKPAFMAEFESLEAKNLEIYNLYCEKVRNLSYLQSALEEYRVMEREKEMKTLKKLQGVRQKLRQQELKMMTNKPDVDDLDDYESNIRKMGNVRSGRSSAKQSPQRHQQEDHGFSATSSMTHSNTQSNSQSASSSGSSSLAESSATSPSRTTSGSQDDGSIGSISDIGDEHMQF